MSANRLTLPDSVMREIMIKEVGILHNIRDNGRRCGDFIFPPKQIDYKELIDNTFISILNSKNLSIILEKRIEI